MGQKTNYMGHKRNKQVGSAVMLQTHIQEVFGLNLRGTPATLTEVCHGFRQSLQANTGIVYQLGHDCFLPNPFKFTIHLSPYHSTLYSLATDGAIKRTKPSKTKLRGFGPRANYTDRATAACWRS
jgi:hypothetical protein